jgi:hypothetical protein
LVPTVPTHYRRDEVARDPLGCNSRVGLYTTFVNLLDLAAISVPASFTGEGLPFGITLIAPAFKDGILASLGAAMHQTSGLPAGRPAKGWSGWRVPGLSGPRLPTGIASLAVAGLHLSGQPLNGQLLEVGARLRGKVRTAPEYRLYALRRGDRHFPGLVKQVEGGGSIELEVWHLTLSALGRFMLKVKPPLVIGTVRLHGGEEVLGFLCESHAVGDAEEITGHGGWMAYLGSLMQ